MATHDYVIANGTGAAVRSDLNGALAAIVSNNSSATEPATMYAYQWWSDTTTGLLKQRNAANSAWITIGTLASANLGLLSLAGGTMTGALAVTASTAAAPSIAFTGDTNTGIYSPGADQLAIATGGQEAIRTTSGGDLLVGTITTGGRLTVASAIATVSPIATTSVTGDTTYQAILVTKFDNNTTTSQNFIQFQVNNGGANCGRITANGANTAAFGSTSDIRLKNNIEDLPPQLQNILSLRPVEFDYIESEGGGHQIGFIAQEMQAIYPDVVSERGEDDMFMITGWSKTEARLVKALQEAVAKIETLEARLSALEGA